MSLSVNKSVLAVFRICLHILLVSGVMLAAVLGVIGGCVTVSVPAGMILAMLRGDVGQWTLDNSVFVLYCLPAVVSLLILSISCYRGLQMLLNGIFPSEAPVWFCLAGAALLPMVLFTFLLEPWATGLVHAALCMLVFDLAFWAAGLGLAAMEPPVLRQSVSRWLAWAFCPVYQLLSSRRRVSVLLFVCSLAALPLGLWIFQPLGSSGFLPWLLTALWSVMWLMLLLRRVRLFAACSAALALILLERLVLKNLITWFVTASASLTGALILLPFLLAPAALLFASACAAYLHSISEVKA